MDLFDLYATLSLDTSSFESALTKVTGKLAKSEIDFYKKEFKTATGAIWDFAKDVIDTGLEVDEAMAGVYAVTETTDEVTQAMLRSAAATEAQKSAFTVAEVAMAEYYEGLAGFDPQQITDGLRGIILAAEASGESLPLIADIITDTVTAFGDGADAQEHYADVLAATATQSNTTIGKMGQALKYIAPIAGSLGYDVEDIALSIGLMADNAIKGSQAGTTLRNIFTRIATNAGATEKDMGALAIVTDRLGVEFYDASGKVRPWIDVLKESRQAWRGMDEEGRKEVAGLFGEIAMEGASADEVLKDFATDVKNVQDAFEVWDNTKNDALAAEKAKEIRETATAYKELFDALGINIDPAKDDINALADAFEKARIRMGEMSDEERVYYAKQIGSMRGMSGWLAMMNVTDEKFDELAESVYNATGAAERMRDIRMGSNLAGDVKSLNAAFDALLDTIYVDVNGPLRELTQYGTDAIVRINDAIEEGGLLGGIQQLAVEIENAGEKLTPILEGIGKAAAPVIESLLTNIGPAIEETGAKLATGLLNGLTSNLKSKALSMIISSFAGLKINQLKNGLFTQLFGVSDNLAIAAPWKAAQKEIAGIKKEFTGDDITQHFKKSAEETVTTWETAAGKIHSGLSGTFASSGQDAVTTFDSVFGTLHGGLSGSFKAATDESAQYLGTNIAAAGEQSATSVGNSLYDKSVSMADRASSYLSWKLVSAGASGGEGAANNVFDKIKSVGTSIKETLDTSMGKAGKNAGGSIASKIQKALSAFQFGISIVGTLTSIFGGGSRRYASAMYDGKVLHGATIFGMSAGGSPLVGGEAGPEAVVGTGELGRLITDAVTAASGGGNYTVNVYQQPGEDTDALVRRIEREIVRKERQRRSALA